MRIILKDLVLEAERDVVEAALGLALLRPELQIARAEADAEVLGDPLRNVDRKGGLARRRLVAAPPGA